MSSSKDRLNLCLESAKRMRKIHLNDKLSKKYIERAKHNLKVAKIAVMRKAIYI